MTFGRKQGAAMIVAGLAILTIAILVLITLPDWGQWMADYPTNALAGDIPTEIKPIASAVLGYVLGPVLEQAGGWMQVGGYFMGTLFCIISLTVTTIGTTLVIKNKK